MEFKTLYDILTVPGITDKQKAERFFDFIVSAAETKAPDLELYYKIKELLSNEKVFAEFILLKESLALPDSEEEMLELNFPALLTEFLKPYVEWKSRPLDPGGTTEELKRLSKWLEKGDFEGVFTATEKLLDTFPDDENILLHNIASRVSLVGAKPQKDRESWLSETRFILEDALERPLNKKHMFLYYSGLIYTAQKDLFQALSKFEEALKLKPGFQPALAMIKAINL